MKINILLVSLLASLCYGEVFSQIAYGGTQKLGYQDFEKKANSTSTNFLQTKSSSELGGGTAVNSYTTNLGNHLVFTDFLLLLFHQAAIGYEYINDSNNIGVRLPITLGYGPNKGYNEFGVDVKFYITKPYSFYRKIGPFDAGDATVLYFLGPAASGIFAEVGKIASLRFSNGVSMQFERGLNLTAYASVGPAMYFTDNNTDSAVSKGDVFVYWALNGCLGWRFSRK